MKTLLTPERRKKCYLAGIFTSALAIAYAILDSADAVYITTFAFAYAYLMKR